VRSKRSQLGDRGERTSALSQALDEAQQQALASAASLYGRADPIGWKEAYLAGELKQLGCLDRGSIRDVQVIPEPFGGSQRITFCDIELHRQSCPLELIHTGMPRSPST